MEHISLSPFPSGTFFGRVRKKAALSPCFEQGERAACLRGATCLCACGFSAVRLVCLLAKASAVTGVPVKGYLRAFSPRSPLPLAGVLHGGGNRGDPSLRRSLCVPSPRYFSTVIAFVRCCTNCSTCKNRCQIFGRGNTIAFFYTRHKRSLQRVFVDVVVHHEPFADVGDGARRAHEPERFIRADGRARCACSRSGTRSSAPSLRAQSATSRRARCPSPLPRNFSKGTVWKGTVFPLRVSKRSSQPARPRKREKSRCNSPSRSGADRLFALDRAHHVIDLRAAEQPVVRVMPKLARKFGKLRFLARAHQHHHPALHPISSFSPSYHTTRRRQSQSPLRISAPRARRKRARSRRASVLSPARFSPQCALFRQNTRPAAYMPPARRA